MRVLIIGASGFIGQHLARRLGSAPAHVVHGTHWSRPPAASSTSWHRVELADGAALEQTFALARPEVVVHLAAMADVGACERDPERASAVNVEATAAIARLCRRHAARLVFVSTEYVFDGRRGFYREDEAPGPNTRYGSTKREAEQRVAELAPRWSVVRTSIVYGWPAPGRRNFVPWLVERLRSGQSYRAPTGVLRTPVYVEHLVDGLVRLTEQDFPGIHHVAGSDCVSMRDFALAVADAFDLDRRQVLPPEAPQEDSGSSERLGLDCAATMGRLRLPHPGLAEGLAAMRASEPA